MPNDPFVDEMEEIILLNLSGAITMDEARRRVRAVFAKYPDIVARHHPEAERLRPEIRRMLADDPKLTRLLKWN